MADHDHPVKEAMKRQKASLAAKPVSAAAAPKIEPPKEAHATAGDATDHAPLDRTEETRPMSTSARTSTLVAAKQAIKDRHANSTEQAVQSANAATGAFRVSNNKGASEEDPKEDEASKDFEYDEEDPPSLEDNNQKDKQPTTTEVIVPKATLVVEETEQAPQKVVVATMHVQEPDNNVVVDKKHMRLIVALLCLLFAGLVVGLSVAFLTGGSNESDVAPVNGNNDNVDVNVIEKNDDEDDSEDDGPDEVVFEPVCTEASGFVQVAGRNVQREADTVFRKLIQESPHQIILRKCSTCAPSHQNIYYRRLTPLPDESIDFLNVFLDTWVDIPANVMGTDFALYSTYSDALTMINEWQFCNFNDPGVGFPRDCSPDPNAIVIRQWTGGVGESVHALVHDFGFYVESTPFVQVAGRNLPSASDKRFRQLIQDSPFQIIRRKCSSCAPSHQDIYYRRHTPLPDEQSINFLNVFLDTWVDHPANVMGTDFNLYSKYEDALAMTNEWLFCNFNDPGVGFPRDCSPDPNAQVFGQWTGGVGESVHALVHDFGFYVECRAP